jgi:di/tricarboxylate transporter
MAEGLILTVPMMVVLGLLCFTVFLFVSEIVSIDVAAVSVMVLLGLSSLVPGLEELISLSDLFSGFSSNAVISIIAVMIIGAGLDRTGITGKLAAMILKHGGTTEKRLIPLISGTVGVISSFMQNVGAAALFLPVVSRISARTGLPLSRLLMPMGFCAILGGTMTMVGSSPLILLNDLILSANRGLPADQQMGSFDLFDVSPVGLALLLTGIAYFAVFGRFVLPKIKTSGAEAVDTLAYFRDAYGVGVTIAEISVPEASPLIGLALKEFEGTCRVRVIAMREGQTMRIGAGSLDKEIGIAAHDTLAVIGSDQGLQAFVDKYGLQRRHTLEAFAESLNPTKAGIAEIVIPPRSSLIGESPLSSWMRKIYGLATLAIHRGGETFGEEHDVRTIPFQAGDTLVVHTQWDNLARLEKDRDFVIVTTEYPHEELRPHKVGQALGFFALALVLVLFTELPLSVALLTGAMGMVLSKVLSMEEAYNAVSWKTVFLLASLIPLGLAVQTTGTAAWIAQQTLALTPDVAPWVIQVVIAVLATVFTLVMSNVGATVLLVPLAVSLAAGIGADPAVFALTVAIATSNSFIIPTHQVNVLIMGPAGYRVADFLRAGGIMTVLFLVVSLVMLNLVF